MSYLTNPPTIPVTLINLFEEMDFLSKALDGHKPCIRDRSFINDKTWKGWFWRRITREGADKVCSFIRRTCEQASQISQMYFNTEFNEILTEKIIHMRAGIIRIHKSYADELTPSIQDHISTSVLILDLNLPRSVKIQYRIILDTKEAVPESKIGVSPPIPIPPRKARTASEMQEPEANEVRPVFHSVPESASDRETHKKRQR